MPTAFTIERFWPVSLAFICAVVWVLGECTVPANLAKEMLAAVLSAAAVFAGFLTTALTILMSIGATAIGRRLAKRNKLKHLFSYLKSAINGCLLLIAGCIAAFFLIEEPTGIGRYASGFLVAAVVYAGAAIFRIVRILVLVVDQMGEPDQADG